MFTSFSTCKSRRSLAIEAIEARVCPAAISTPAGDFAEAEDDQVADFQLVDVNPNSATHNQTISPRDYLGQVSAWYFGHAT
jgi:hypothetical protein